MSSLKTILVVDDNALNRTILSKILSESYSVVEAEDGKAALFMLDEQKFEIDAVMLDVVMPVMDGFAFLEALHSNSKHENLPVIVTTGNNEHTNERKALSLGAWDFVSKPYDPEIIRFRLKNAIDRSQLAALKQLQYLSAFDTLTGIYNKSKFFEATREMLSENRNESFVFLRFDVDRFQLINSFFGTAEGDKLLKYIADCVRNTACQIEHFTYGRMESDIFCCCLPAEPQQLNQVVRDSRIKLVQFNPTYDIVPSIGLYLIEDNSLSVETMYNRATQAAKTCKGNYVDYYAFYDQSMSQKLNLEQEITNEMNHALESGQFQIYLQPQYNIQQDQMYGAEALVRWIHPQKGIIAPGEFISVFERNGFITKLDFYVWEQACTCLRKWIDQGKKPNPISVNISRVHLYNPRLAENILQLVQRYELDPALLHLELTESAYTDNPTVAIDTIAQLQSYGFVILMDDFGSGYSSLNILKDIAVNILKIDMRFLSQTKIAGRGENIIASVVRMAKWLNIPVVTEGVETKEQMEFLKSIGCDFIQGFYFAKPMPVADYEALCDHGATATLLGKSNVSLPAYHFDELFVQNPQMEKQFGNSQQAAALYEFSGKHIELIRANNAFHHLFGQTDEALKTLDMLNFVDEADRQTVLDACLACDAVDHKAVCEFVCRQTGGAPLWIREELAYVSAIGEKSILAGTLTDITLQKEIERELHHYRNSLLSHTEGCNTVLIVDDALTNRMILRKIFENRYHILEAENGKAALEILQEHKAKVDVILLDIMMPVMDGKAFLLQKQKTPELDSIPVVMITADDSPEQQVTMLSLGASDYIVKPFIPEIVARRVKNVMGFNRHFKEMIREYSNMSEKVKTDQMTKLLNRTSAEEMITQQLNAHTGLHAMMMLDIDNFKGINDSRGHIMGDIVIQAVAKNLREFFRQNDVVARMGGDEFAVFIDDIPQRKLAEEKASELCKKLSHITINNENVMISCSIGLVISDQESDTFETLYRDADKALYNAKCNGKCSVSVFGKDTAEAITKRITDADGIINDVQDCLYISNFDTYELLYANDYACRVAGIHKQDYFGKKCYEVLLHKDAPCDFCARDKLLETEVYTRTFRTPDFPNAFLLRGKKLNWNGIPAHLEIAVELKDRSEEVTNHEP
ncbi:MAG: EAL domain-containing protein [Clostridia bacterium]